MTGEGLRSRLGLVSQEEFALMLGVSVDTVSEWRRLKRGPDFVKTGKGVMYREADILEWLSLNVVAVIRRVE
jgi:predicted DNA-binding transcriptional regulator AlpA